MQEIGYDELYGVNLDEYCKFHQITIDDLMNKTKKDIELLNKRLYILVCKKNKLGSQITNEVYKLLQKKKKHLERLKKWKRKNK